MSQWGMSNIPPALLAFAPELVFLPNLPIMFTGVLEYYNTRLDIICTHSDHLDTMVIILGGSGVGQIYPQPCSLSPQS